MCLLKQEYLNTNVFLRLAMPEIKYDVLKLLNIPQRQEKSVK